MTSPAYRLVRSDTYPSNGQAWYLLGVLIIAGILSFVDRQILGLLVQPIRADLKISDTEISLLQGFAFAVFYVFLGFPLGRYADRANRRNLIVVGIGFWSLATMACGLASSYWELFAARVCVGIGEAALAPAAYSMLCDAFRKERRGTALGVYHTSIYLGIGLSIVVAGLTLALIRSKTHVELPLIGMVRSWQAAFIIVGAPGILVALLMLTTIEPVRQMALAKAPPVREAWGYLKHHRKLATLQILGFSFLALASYGMSTWVPTFFIRVHHWTAAEVGVAYGMAVTIFGTLGVILGGIVGDRWKNAGREDARLLLSAGAAAMFIPMAGIGLTQSNPTISLAFIGGSALFSSITIGLGLTAMQDIVPDWLRGQASAIFLFAINLVGLGLGPTAVALVTDKVFKDDLSLPLSISWVSLPAACISVMLILAARPAYRKIVADLEK